MKDLVFFVGWCALAAPAFALAPLPPEIAPQMQQIAQCWNIEDQSYQLAGVMEKSQAEALDHFFKASKPAPTSTILVFHRQLKTKTSQNKPVTIEHFVSITLNMATGKAPECARRITWFPKGPRCKKDQHLCLPQG